MDFKPFYSEIKQDNKDNTYLVHYAEHSTVKLTDAYNSAGDSYFGVEIECFIENIRGVLRVFPNFIDEVDVDVRRGLSKLGFEKREPTEMELLLYKKR